MNNRRDLTDLYCLGNGVSLTKAVAVSADTTRTLAVALGDLDLDGDLEFVTGNGNLANKPINPLQPNRLYMNRIIPSGSTGFTAGTNISPDTDKTRDIVLAELDGHGDLDVVAANDQTTAHNNRNYLNKCLPTQTMQFASGIDIGDPDDETSNVLVGHLDNHGDADLVFLNHGRPNRFHLNHWTDTAGIFSFGPALDVRADVDGTGGGTLFDAEGDGGLDLAVVYPLPRDPRESGRNKLDFNRFIETGVVAFFAGIDIGAEEEESRDLAAFDLNGDVHIDIVIANEDVPDRRYPNNGTDRPFTNRKPSITGQARALSAQTGTELTIDLTDGTVGDPDNVFPHDFALTVQPGAGYALDGNTITPEGGAASLSVPVIVNDGTDNSSAEVRARPILVAERIRSIRERHRPAGRSRRDRNAQSEGCNVLLVKPAAEVTVPSVRMLKQSPMSDNPCVRGCGTLILVDDSCRAHICSTEAIKRY